MLGYIRLTDFGVAKIVQKNNANETSGTPGYMSPEVLCAQNHSFPTDFFAIGVMGYEFMLGERPYVGKTRKDIKQAVLSHQVLIDHDDLPEGWSRESAFFINALLQRKPQKRLGYISGIRDLKNHRWFKDFNWTDLMNKTMPSPFAPKHSGNYDKKYCEGFEPINTETRELYQEIMQKDDYVSLFNSYTYINTEDKKILIQQYREKSMGHKTIGTTENLSSHLRISQETQATFTKNKSLLFKTPLFLNRNSSNFCDIKDSSRRTIGRKGADFLPHTDHSKTLFKLPHNIALRNKNIKTLRLFKKLEGSLSCKVINPQLPVLNINQANFNLIQYPIINSNNNEETNTNNNNNKNEHNNPIQKPTKRKKRKMLPMSLDNNMYANFKILHKTESGKLNINLNGH